MDSEEEVSSAAGSEHDLELPSQTRTLFHYFGRKESQYCKPLQEMNEREADREKHNVPIPTAGDGDKRKDVVDPNPIEASPKESKASVEKLSTDVKEEECGEVPKASPKSSIQNFFSKVSKSEYRKSFEREQASSKIVVEALVHRGDGDSKPKRPAPISASSVVSQKVSNVSRPTKETDVIQVLQEEIVIVSTENGGEVLSESEKEEPAFLFPDDSSVGDVEFFRQHCLQSRTLLSPPPPFQNPPLPTGEGLNPTVREVAAAKISTRLFGSSKRRRTSNAKRNGKTIDYVIDDGSGLFKKKERTKKPRHDKNKLCEYDSDCVDLDKLAAYNRKTFIDVSPTSCLDSSADESPFSALMRKPIINQSSNEAEVAFATTGPSPTGDKENKYGGSNDAFTKLMSKQESKGSSNQSLAGEKKRGRQRKAAVNGISSNGVGKENDCCAGMVVLDEKIIAKDCNEKAETSGFGRERRKSSRIKLRQESEGAARKADNWLQFYGSSEEDDPRPRKRVKKTRKKGPKEIVVVATCEDKDTEEEDVKVEKIVVKSPNKKLASIFTKGKVATVIKDSEREAAKKAFLLSSAPEALRSQVSRYEESASLASHYHNFSVIGHVQQRESVDDEFWLLPRPAQLKLKPESQPPNNLEIKSQFGGTKVTGSAEGESFESKMIKRLLPHEIANVLRKLGNKDLDHVFLSYLERRLESDVMEEEAKRKNLNLNEIEEQRSLRSGRKRRRNKNDSDSFDKQLLCVNYDPFKESSMNWTAKFSPRLADDVIGNSVVVSNLKAWLDEWGENLKNASVESDEDVSDDELLPAGSQNTALLMGPNGVGKTASVYALAREMGFRVLEVNSSSCRNGKAVLANLREATQSHSVRNNDHVVRQPMSLGERSEPSRKTLILFEDIDIVFDDLDDGFLAAVNTLISTTKRPILLTTSSANYMTSAKSKPIVKFVSFQRCFTFEPVSSQLVASHLQMMALVEGFYVDLDEILWLIRHNENYISSSIHSLHFLLMSLPRIERSSRSVEPEEMRSLVSRKEEDDGQSQPSDCEAYTFERQSIFSRRYSASSEYVGGSGKQAIRELSERCEIRSLFGGRSMFYSGVGRLSDEELCSSIMESWNVRGYDHVEQECVRQIHSAERQVFDCFELWASSKRCLLDYMPAIREIARKEESRKLDTAGPSNKRCRSRFLHYFETQNLFLRPDTLAVVTKPFSTA